jgi:trk system potassium uptake protein TrkA
MSLVSNQDYVGIIRSLGIDAHVSPKALTISTILQHVRRGSIRRVHAVQNSAAEIVEAEALETSPLVGKPLRDVGIPDGMRVGAVVRDGTVIMPDGDTEVKSHDRVVMFTLAGRVREVEQMFRVSLEYF